MKYCYKGAEPAELIKNYKKSNDKIIITFLDNSTYEIPATKENETNLLNHMIGQAQERNNIRERLNIDLQQQKDLRLGWTIIQSSFAAIIIGMTLNTGLYFSGFLGGITALTAVIDGLEYLTSKKHIDELEKYNIYLPIREKLEGIKDPNLFNGISKQKEQLNINTLDSYSLNDLKTIKSNIEKMKRYEKFNCNTNKSVLTKKISK